MIYRLIAKLLYESAAIRDRVHTRIHFERAPQHRPGEPIGTIEERIVIGGLGGSADYHLLAECDSANPVIEVACTSDSSTKANSLYELVRNRLSGYRGTVEVLDDLGIMQEIDVHEITIVRLGMLVEQPADASDQAPYRCSGDFSVFHEQSVPTLT